MHKDYAIPLVLFVVAVWLWWFVFRPSTNDDPAWLLPVQKSMGTEATFIYDNRMCISGVHAGGVNSVYGVSWGHKHMDMPEGVYTPTCDVKEEEE